MLLFANNATTECAGSISATATQINVAAGEGIYFPNPGPGDYFVATLYKNDASNLHEIVHVTARNGDTMTIARAQENTQPQPWNPGDTFSALITAGMLGMFEQGNFEVTPASLVYTGQDVGGSNVVVVPVVSPALTGLVTGMTFNIAIAADNTGPTNITIGSFATHPIVRLDGTPLVGGNLRGGMMMKMWFDGSRFVAPFQNVPISPISRQFYLDPNGNDANDGLTPGTAFRTPNGCVIAIEDRYTSQKEIAIRVAPGRYEGGPYIAGSYIAYWHFYGDPANPDSVLFDATDPTGPSGGNGLACGNGANVLMQGIRFESYEGNFAIGSGATVTSRECVFTPPTGNPNSPSIYSGQSGEVTCVGNLIYDARNGLASVALWGSDTNSSIYLSKYTVFGVDGLHVQFRGTPRFTQGIAMSIDGSVLTVSDPAYVTWEFANTVQGPKFAVINGSGITGTGGNIDFFPGDQPGTIDTATYCWYK